jgi:hypothetical protein
MKDSIERIKNWRTTVIGMVSLVLAVFMMVSNYLSKGNCAYPWIAIIVTLILSYAFTFAKDSLIEGITHGLIKIK